MYFTDQHGRHPDLSLLVLFVSLSPELNLHFQPGRFHFKARGIISTLFSLCVFIGQFIVSCQDLTTCVISHREVRDYFSHLRFFFGSENWKVVLKPRAILKQSTISLPRGVEMTSIYAKTHTLTSGPYSQIFPMILVPYSDMIFILTPEEDR